ncbi:MAG: hypothetical protein AAB433_07655 [Nitrospirota bacterium]
MSLVVAQATDDGPRIISDTRVVFPDGPRSSFTTDTLKAVVVARDFTICFAGDVLAGLEGVREFAREIEMGQPVENLLPRLHELTLNRRRPVEFIVAQRSCQPQLTRISDGGIEHNLQTVWIGDQNGFERFQAERNKTLDSVGSLLENHLTPSGRVMNSLQRAMQAVIDDPTIESVGNFCIAVTCKSSGFQYLSSLFVHVGRDFHIEAGENIFPMMVQPVAEGGYSVSVVPPVEPGTPALGLNFPTARLGMVYLPLKFDGAEVIRDISPNDFVKAVKSHFGVAMEEPMLRYK